ncbi:hypothetical protein [Marinibactrum halimedae]|uniref:Uncharacterized protein n=1 Tax=Marinibactrum halimedae TaxID=1444977 RepID=A0AA37T2A1_9GAMM|nr:hypothetical protein [Marinibactrum halimedae]MCD9458094.1 hypothetical protein [Marinibactrum halimedae]GLS25028.1 hypothetical protein GCM10007877_07420 [Marinibactrum halimedae]
MVNSTQALKEIEKHIAPAQDAGGMLTTAKQSKHVKTYLGTTEKLLEHATELGGKTLSNLSIGASAWRISTLSTDSSRVGQLNTFSTATREGLSVGTKHVGKSVKDAVNPISGLVGDALGLIQTVYNATRNYPNLHGHNWMEGINTDRLSSEWRLLLEEDAKTVAIQFAKRAELMCDKSAVNIACHLTNIGLRIGQLAGGGPALGLVSQLVNQVLTIADVLTTPEGELTKFASAYTNVLILTSQPALSKKIKVITNSEDDQYLFSLIHPEQGRWKNRAEALMANVNAIREDTYKSLGPQMSMSGSQFDVRKTQRYKVCHANVFHLLREKIKKRYGG